MNRDCHERLANRWRRKRRSLLLPVKLLTTLVFLSVLAGAQSLGQTTPVGAVCPLSESQTEKSIQAFSKIASTISSENRCLGCHGRVNPHIDGTGADPDAKSAFDMKGEVGEKIDGKEDSIPGVVTKMHLEIVKKE